MTILTCRQYKENLSELQLLHKHLYNSRIFIWYKYITIMQLISIRLRFEMLHIKFNCIEWRLLVPSSHAPNSYSIDTNLLLFERNCLHGNFIPSGIFHRYSFSLSTFKYVINYWKLCMYLFYNFLYYIQMIQNSCALQS